MAIFYNQKFRMFVQQVQVKMEDSNRKESAHYKERLQGMGKVSLICI